MGKEQLFAVDLKGFEPHTHRNGKGFRKVKKELREAIANRVGMVEIEEARKRINAKPVRVKVLFRLWMGSSKTTKTRSEKDLDNLLKPVLDVLQTHTDERKNEWGLGLIENDNQVFEINAQKELVESPTDEGMQIVIETFPQSD
ncbi:MAG: RusA family crossover junction endodeoxyribonuclease [Nitrososphaerales archaeon]